MKDLYMLIQYSQIDLHHFVKKNPYTESRLGDVLLHDVGQALKHHHRTLKCVHHDVKPLNILVHGNYYKLTDFGLMTDYSAITVRSTFTRLGSGGFGQVYKVTHRTTGIKYAIKRFREQNVRWIHILEVENSEKVDNHLHCTGYMGAWKQMKNLYVLIQYSQIDHHHFVKKNQYTELRLGDVLLHDVGQALKHLHITLKCVHHDVKPLNILVHGNYFKLTDFGLMTDYSA
uniref:mitogen-activated protein kinase kinase n=1 Tax=Diabrotica virgifera virgifera TaxID=50390 RepID=A0A6P7GYF2_DIAVI